MGEAVAQCTINVTTTINSVPACQASDGEFEITPSSGTPPYNYSIDTGKTFLTSGIFSGLPAGIYIVISKDANNCYDTTGVILDNPNSASINGNPTNVLCNGDLNGSIGVTLSAGTPPYAVQWSGNSSSNAENLTNIAAGVYNITVTDGANCVSSSSFSIIEPAPLTGTIVNTVVGCSGASALDLDVQGGTPVYTYLWTDGSISEDLLLALPGYHTVTITDINGCSTTQSEFVDALQQVCLTIPNAFTPNGDGIQDYWNIGGIDQYNDPEVRVYNRWGEAVFKSVGYKKPWNGRVNNAHVPMASYYYVIELKEVENGVIKGIVNIKR